MTLHPCRAGGGGGPRLLRAAPVLLLLLFGLPAGTAALETVWLVRHAEKAEPWPPDRGLDAFQPLSPAGAARAEALAGRLHAAGIAEVYTSRTTRSIATAMPLVARLRIPLTADDDSVRPDAMPGFLSRLRQEHAGDRAVLVVAHSNTLPHLLTLLGASPECHARLGFVADPEHGLLVEGYEGLWWVDLARPGCAGVVRE